MPSLPVVGEKSDVFVIPNVSLIGYVGGLEMDFIKGQEAINRADFEDKSLASQSLISYPIPRCTEPKSDIIYLADKNRDETPGLNYLDFFFKFNEARNHLKNKKKEIIFAAMSGSCRRFDRKSCRFDFFEQGGGPLGDKIYQGCRRVLDGTEPVQPTVNGVINRIN
jgi:hypothetical protein